MTAPDLDLTLDELRPLLIGAMLPHVAFDGWSRSALLGGAANLGVDPDVAKLAFDGPLDMIDAFTARADAAMVAQLEAEDVLAMKVRARITRAVRIRLEQAEGHREAVRRAVAVLAMPQNAARSAALLWRTADAMWRAAGDTATDFNHYTKRLILGGVYSATLLYWLGDDSEARAETWAFLDRRIADVMKIEAAKQRRRQGAIYRPSVVRFLGRLRYPAA